MIEEDEIARALIVPEDNYLYTKTHKWISLDDKNMIAMMGVTYYAQDLLGEVLYWKLPQKGQNFEKGQPFGLLESNREVSDLYSPVTGEVVEVNSSLTSGLISDYPMREGWLLRIEISKESELNDSMDSVAYRAYVQEELKKRESINSTIKS